MLTGCSGTLVRDSQHGLLRLPLALVTLCARGRCVAVSFMRLTLLQHRYIV